MSSPRRRTLGAAEAEASPRATVAQRCPARHTSAARKFAATRPATLPLERSRAQRQHLQSRSCAERLWQRVDRRGLSRQLPSRLLIRPSATAKPLDAWAKRLTSTPETQPCRVASPPPPAWAMPLAWQPQASQRGRCAPQTAMARHARPRCRCPARRFVGRRLGSWWRICPKEASTPRKHAARRRERPTEKKCGRCRQV